MALLAEKTQPTVPQLESRKNIDVTVRKAQPSDFHEVWSFLKRNFFLDEPLNYSVGFLKGDPTTVKLKAFCREMLGKDCSFVAEIDGHLAGVIITSIINRDESARHSPKLPEAIKLSDSADTKFEAIENLMETVFETINLFKRYPNVDSIIGIEIMSVQSDLQGRGIGKKLLQACRDLASERRVPIILCICSSHYSALAVKRLGYQWIYEIPYTDYKDSSGKPVFSPAPPHKCMAAYIYLLET